MAEITEKVEILKSESSIITTELLETAIRSKESCDKLIVKNFKVTAGSQSGDNYASIVFSVHVTVEDKYGEEKVYDLFLKTAHNTELLREWTFVESKIFLKEEKAYTDVIPDMIRYQTDCGLKPFGPSVPEYYYSIVENYTGVIILEDIRTHGYRMADRVKGLDNEHCKLVMKELAAFHALSYALKDGNAENLKKYDWLFHDSLFSERVPLGMGFGLKASVDLIKQYATDDNVIEHAQKLLSLDMFETIKEHIKPIEPYAVICHGDTWCNNMMFKYDDDDDKQKPVDLKLLDLQIFRYALPSTDLAYFFYLSTTRNIREKHMCDLLRLYHTTLTGYIKQLKTDFQVFSFEELEEMFKNSVRYAVIFATFGLPAILAKPETHQEFDVKDESGVQAFIDDHYKRIAEIDENMLIIRERLIGTVEEAIEMGVI